MLCRDKNDCTWLDNNLECDDYNIEWDKSSGWFGGDTTSVMGTCDCIEGKVWSDDAIGCQEPGLTGMKIFLIIVIAISALACSGCILCCGILASASPSESEL